MDETKLSVLHEHGQEDVTHGTTNLPEAEHGQKMELDALESELGMLEWSTEQLVKNMNTWATKYYIQRRALDTIGRAVVEGVTKLSGANTKSSIMESIQQVLENNKGAIRDAEEHKTNERPLDPLDIKLASLKVDRAEIAENSSDNLEDKLTHIKNEYEKLIRELTGRVQGLMNTYNTYNEFTNTLVKRLASVGESLTGGKTKNAMLYELNQVFDEKKND